MALTRNQQGQISIFFSASLVVLVTIVAFVINVGLFVKAKINLQNSTDAAAFAGAAVQARQLTKIAHLNWEMRNIYKEWMYKYYVIGNLNLPGVRNSGSAGVTDFRMEPDTNVLKPVGDPMRVVDDPYNFPSVCIHLENSQTNICKRYSIPGLPEFGSSNLPGAEEASRAFQNALISTKVMDCVQRTQLNMFVATSWAYNILSASGITLAGQGPAIMADRQGAWPRAVELAMRIRNLEKVVNREARKKSVCITPGASDKVNCGVGIDEISNEPAPGNERLVKAFYSGYRNIGGSFTDDEMKQSFTLTEIPPVMFREPKMTNASNLLIPDPSYEKQYLDLKLMMVNYAIFYSAMIPRADTKTSGACDVSKVAIPVPGYPLGFYKSPEFVTYYAVKGEAEFEGMFNPFGERVKLTAFAAAKPMGGRIGPMLFTQKPNQEAIIGRLDPIKRRSVPYMATIDLVGANQRLLIPDNDPALPGTWVKKLITSPDGKYYPGMPLPVNGPNTAFWLDGPGKAVGGKISTGVQFGIPNMPYDFKKHYSSEGYTTSAAPIHTINAKDPLGPSPDREVGLFSQDQFTRFKGAIGNSIGPDQLDEAVARVRSPTSYEAANYLIPVPFERYSSSNLGHFGQISGKGKPVGPNGILRYVNYIYAPLYGTDSNEILYRDTAAVLAAIKNFMFEQESGIRKYVDAMNSGAKAINDMGANVSGGATGSRAGYVKAAAGVSDLASYAPADIMNKNPKTCKSLTGTFLHFYYGGLGAAPPGMIAAGMPIKYAGTPGTHPNGTLIDPPVDCPASISELLQSYFSNGAGDDPNFRNSHYRMEYSIDDRLLSAGPVPEKYGIFSGYAPGAFTGVKANGIFTNLAGISEMMRRNFYSTKFIPLHSVTNGGYYNESVGRFNTFSEGDVQFINSDLKQNQYRNPLQLQDHPEATGIKH